MFNHNAISVYDAVGISEHEVDMILNHPEQVDDIDKLRRGISVLIAYVIDRFCEQPSIWLFLFAPLLKSLNYETKSQLVEDVYEYLKSASKETLVVLAEQLPSLMSICPSIARNQIQNVSTDIYNKVKELFDTGQTEQLIQYLNSIDRHSATFAMIKLINEVNPVLGRELIISSLPNWLIEDVLYNIVSHKLESIVTHLHKTPQQ